MDEFHLSAESVGGLISYLRGNGASIFHNKTTGSLRMARNGVYSHLPDSEDILLLSDDLLLMVYPEIHNLRNWSVFGIVSGAFESLEYDPYVKEWL